MNRVFEQLIGHIIIHSQLMRAVLLENEDDIRRLYGELTISIKVLEAYLKNWKSGLLK